MRERATRQLKPFHRSRAMRAIPRPSRDAGFAPSLIPFALRSSALFFPTLKNRFRSRAAFPRTHADAAAPSCRGFPDHIGRVKSSLALRDIRVKHHLKQQSPTPRKFASSPLQVPPPPHTLFDQIRPQVICVCSRSHGQPSGARSPAPATSPVFRTTRPAAAALAFAAWCRFLPHSLRHFFRSFHFSPGI